VAIPNTYQCFLLHLKPTTNMPTTNTSATNKSTTNKPTTNTPATATATATAKPTSILLLWY